MSGQQLKSSASKARLFLPASVSFGRVLTNRGGQGGDKYGACALWDDFSLPSLAYPHVTLAAMSPLLGMQVNLHTLFGPAWFRGT